MKYLAEITPPIELANKADDNGGPGALFEFIAKRFKPEAMHGSAVERSLVLILDLPKPEDVAELMFICGRGANCTPRLVPLIEPGALMETLRRTNSAPRLG